MSGPSSLHFNGINASTGNYLFAPSDAERLARELTGKAPSPPSATRGRERPSAPDSFRGTMSGIDVRELDQAGWAAVFPAMEPGSPGAAQQERIARALRPLFELRREQATRLDERFFQIYRGPEGYRPEEGKRKFLARLGAGPNPVDPERVPYYLLLVADPEQIPYTVQYQLDVQYAVGRICFDTLEEYANYARSVVSAETSPPEHRERELTMVAVANPDDPATALSSTSLVEPLAQKMASRAPGWVVRRHSAEHAHKVDLARVLGGEATPSLLFTASHGVGFDRGDPRQRSEQGALLCQDWAGPRAAGGPITPDAYFGASDVSPQADLHGLIMFNFACYCAGTPKYDEYSQPAGSEARRQIADDPFVAALPQRLLSHPPGGALAVIGHVDRAWGTSIVWPGLRDSPQVVAFESTLRDLVEGVPVGAALEYFNQRYAELAADLTLLLDEIRRDEPYEDVELTTMWSATSDARGYAIVGDPAVRLPWPRSTDRLRGSGRVQGPR